MLMLSQSAYADEYMFKYMLLTHNKWSSTLPPVHPHPSCPCTSAGCLLQISCEVVCQCGQQPYLPVQQVYGAWRSFETNSGGFEKQNQLSTMLLSGAKLSISFSIPSSNGPGSPSCGFLGIAKQMCGFTQQHSAAWQENGVARVDSSVGFGGMQSNGKHTACY